jgi:FKBP-type peptidyl-prolyl cis-trans isomerase
MRRFILPLLCLAVGLVACKNDPVGPTPIEDEKFAPELRVNLSEMTKTGSGLYLQDLVVGNGKVAASGDLVEVHYTGWLTNGKQFDTSIGEAPIKFPLGVGAVIDGWEEGLQGMRVGGTRKLVIPSHLGYRGRRRGSIPPHSTLVFDVVLVGVVVEEEDE